MYVNEFQYKTNSDADKMLSKRILNVPMKKYDPTTHKIRKNKF